MRRLAGPLAAAALACLGLVRLSAAATPALTPVELGLGGKTIFSYLPLTLADRLGFFRDAGLDVRFHDFPGGSKSVEALVAGSVDMVAGSYENTLFLQAKGIDLKAPLLLTDRFGLVLGLRKDLAATYHSPRDLKGLKIGVTAPGSAVANAVEIILAKDGLTPDDVSMIGVGAGPGAIAAVKAKRIDALMFSDPAITMLQEQGDLVPVVDTRTPEGQDYVYGGPNANSSVLTTARFASAQRPMVQAFVDAMTRTMRWLGTASMDTIVAAIPPEYFGSTDRDLYRRSLAANMDAFVRDGHLTQPLAMQTYAVMVKSGRLAGAQALDVAKTLDDSFWETAQSSRSQ